MLLSELLVTFLYKESCSFNSYIREAYLLVFFNSFAIQELSGYFKGADNSANLVKFPLNIQHKYTESF